MSRWQYRIYGLVLSASHPLPGLVPSPDTGSVDIQVDLLGDADADWPYASEHPPVDAHWMAIWREARADGEHLRILFNQDDIPGHTEFAISPNGGRILGRWQDTRSEDGIALLLGAVIACALRIRGLLCLHSSVIRIGDHAIAVLGDKGMGKSTTAAALAQRGYPIQADDIAVLTEHHQAEHDQRWMAQSGETRLRLWPASLQVLSTDHLASAPILSIGDKQALTLDRDSDGDAWQFNPEPLPLARIYLLAPRQAELRHPEITPVAPTEALMALLGQVSVRKLPLQPGQKAREFERLSRLAGTVPVRRIHRPDDLDSLQPLCDAIISDTLDGLRA